MSQPSSQRSRSEPAPTRILPIDDTRPLWSGFRYTVALRTVIVKCMLEQLTLEQIANIRAGGGFPGGNRSAQLASMYQNVRAAIEADNEEHGLRTRFADLPDANAVVRTAKLYTRKFLQQGHVHDDASNWVGKRVEHHLETLQELYNIAMAGYKSGEGGAEDCDWSMPALVEMLDNEGSDDEDDSYSMGSSAESSDTESDLSEDASALADGEPGPDMQQDTDDEAAGAGDAGAAVGDDETVLPFRNVEQIYRMRPRFKHLVDNVLKLKTMRGVFSMMKQAFPKLRKVALAAKKPRNYAEVQVSHLGVRACMCEIIRQAA